jgi:hypothetical protein
VRTESGDAVYSNLWIGGPNCIPDSTVSNPTLTAVSITHSLRDQGTSGSLFLAFQVAYALQGADDLLHVLRGA